MAGLRGKREREKEKREKGEKMGIKSLLFIFYRSTHMFFHIHSGHFCIEKETCILYPLLFSIKMSMMDQ